MNKNNQQKDNLKSANFKSKAKIEIEIDEEIADALTNKKKEYLQEEILDKNGKFRYLEDPIEYKKARK